MQKKLFHGILISILCFLVCASGRYRRSGAITIKSGYALQENTSPSSTPQPLLTGHLLISPYASRDRVLELVQSAKYQIDLRGYQLTDADLIRLLKNKAKAGVTVRLIIEDSMYGNQEKDYRSLAKEIQHTPIQIKSDRDLGTNFMHAKTIVIDKETSIISTANFTYPGFYVNREYRFVSTNAFYGNILSRQFDHDRAGTRDHPPLPENVWICPFNCRQLLHPFIDAATTSIDMHVQYLEDPLLIQQLIEKKEAGISVRVITGKYQDVGKLGALLPDTLIQNSPNNHAKNILIDGKELYIGSMNMSTNAIENNREIGIVTLDQYVIKRFLDQFTSDLSGLSNNAS